MISGFMGLSPTLGSGCWQCGACLGFYLFPSLCPAPLRTRILSQWINKLKKKIWQDWVLKGLHWASTPWPYWLYAYVWELGENKLPISLSGSIVICQESPLLLAGGRAAESSRLGCFWNQLTWLVLPLPKHLPPGPSVSQSKVSSIRQATPLPLKGAQTGYSDWHWKDLCFGRETFSFDDRNVILYTLYWEHNGP